MPTQLNPDNFEIIRDLFPKHYPNLAFVYAALDKNINAEVWVDEVNHPQATLVICGFYIFMAGKITKKMFDECYLIIIERVKLLEKMSTNVKTTLSLVCPEEMLESPINFEELGFVTLPRLEYGYKENSSLPELKAEGDYELIPVDKNNISNCLWNGFIRDICGDENLNHHLGFMLWDRKSQCVASEAFGFVGGDTMEIGTVTNPAYVKKGLATNVCTRLILEATKRGLHPLWSCSKDNLSSNKTAQKLGMVAKQEYNFKNLGKK